MEQHFIKGQHISLFSLLFLRVVAEDHPGDVQPERGDDRDPGAGAGQRLAGEEEVPLHREALQAGVDTVDKLSQI